MYNTESSFTPELNLKVDDLLFYQDASIDQQKGIELYQQYISEGKYEDAYNVREEYHLHSFNADLVNMLINRIKRTQEQVLKLSKKENIYFETTRPANTSYGTIWISKRNEV